MRLFCFCASIGKFYGGRMKEEGGGFLAFAIMNERGRENE